MKNTIIFGLIVLSLAVALSSCKENPVPPEDQPQVSLTLEDVSCTEAWIKLNVTNLTFPADVELYRDSNLAESISLSNTDSLLYIDSLLPNQTYEFHTTINSYNHTITSDPLQVSTMDTTSHNFTWQTWTFGGQAGSCTLYDVAIIDENDIWAVGEIYLLDTTGVPDPNAYNAVHWDGNQWKLKRLEYYGSCSAVRFPPLKAIWAFSASNIVVTNGGSIGWFDGNTVNLDCGVNPLLTGAINKIWGGSSNDLYITGNGGNIVHYQNGQWSRIESGTAANLNDVWGIPNQNGGFDIYVAAENSMLKIDNNNVLTAINGISGQIIISLWGISERLIYTAGNGVVLYKNNAWEKIDKPDVNSIYRIKGEELNEIYGISSPGNVIKYFNGYNWYTINTEIDNRYWQIVSKANKVAVSGYRGEAAIVTIITKN